MSRARPRSPYMSSTESQYEAVTLDGASAGREPRLYYGWVMFPIATVGLIATGPGQTFSISTFNEPMREALGLSHSQLTGAYMVGTFLASLPMGYVGAMADRVGIRRAMTAVVVLFGLVCMAMSRVSGPVTIFLGFLLLRMLGAGALGLLSGNTLAYWFERRLGTVEGMRHVGMAGAIALLPAANLWLIDRVGWRGAWVVLGLGVWAAVLPLMPWFRNGPEEVGQRMDGASEPDGERDAGSGALASLTFAEARRTRAFWIVCAITALWAMLITAVLFNIVPLFLDRGLSEADAARLFTGFAVSLATMQFAGGVLADRVSLNRLLAMAAAAMGLGMWMLRSIGTPAMVLPVAAVLGVSQGLLTASAGPLWPRYYGTAHLGRIRGTIATVLVGSSSVGPFVLGLCVDWTGGYDAALLLFAWLPLPLVFLALLATPPARAWSGP